MPSSTLINFPAFLTPKFTWDRTFPLIWYSVEELIIPLHMPYWIIFQVIFFRLPLHCMAKVHSEEQKDALRKAVSVIQEKISLILC